MKTLKLFVFAIAIFTLSACSSDDDSNSTPPAVELTIANLTGTYDVFSVTDSSERTVTTNGITVLVSSYVSSGDTFTDTVFTFNADGTYTSSGSYRETSTNTITGQTPITETEIVSIDDSGTYTVNETSRTITLDGDIIYDVTLFNDTELRVVENYTESDQSFTDIGEFEIRMTKQN